MTSHPSHLIIAVQGRRSDVDRHKYTLSTYDTTRYYNVRSKADMSQLNLPHGTDNEKWKTEKTEK